VIKAAALVSVAATPLKLVQKNISDWVDVFTLMQADGFGTCGSTLAVTVPFVADPTPA
jgi:hypothetical protein